MNLRIEYDEANTEGRLLVSSGFPIHIWNRVKELAIAKQGDAITRGNTIITEWTTILSMAPELAALGRKFGFTFEYEEQAKIFLKRYQIEYRAVRAIEGSLTLSIPEDEIQLRLDGLGFKRNLKQEQVRDAARLLTLSHGANFSVPGAGKTTVAFAVHLLAKAEDTFLMVVSPKNAFTAWDEVVIDCINPEHPQADYSGFIRLEGDSDSIQGILRMGSRRFIISYDKLVRIPEIINRFLSTNKVHVILDESHRMKAGERSQRGSVLLSLAHLPIRRDILSGTPIPRSIEDIAPQIDFLWPGQGIGLRTTTTNTPQNVLRNLYVRTTKHELKLPPIMRHFVHVEMSQAQLALYALLRQEVLKRLAGIKANPNVDFRAARKSVIRLLQASSHPILAVRGMTTEEPELYPYDDPKIESIFSAIVAESDSSKMLKASEMARSLVAQGRKVVIWASFTHTVERMASLLVDVGASYIHGQIDTGSAADPNTREGRIRLFHDEDAGCNVLVANPAACAEGISLHRVCHDAIYIDRTFNASHYLQSVDRIHRIGIPSDKETHISILESVAPNITGAIDFSIRRRLIEKLRLMSRALEDTDLRSLALDEEEGEHPLDFDIHYEDLVDLIEELLGQSRKAGEEED